MVQKAIGHQWLAAKGLTASPTREEQWPQAGFQPKYQWQGNSSAQRIYSFTMTTGLKGKRLRFATPLSVSQKMAQLKIKQRNDITAAWVSG